MRIFSEAHYAFIEKRKSAYMFSGLLLLVAIGAMLANVAFIGSWQQYGVDFTGGSLIQVRFESPMTAGELRDALGGGQRPDHHPVRYRERFHHSGSGHGRRRRR